MKTTLLKILWKKECDHWKRINSLFNKFKDWPTKLTFGLIIALFIIIFHYMFALMHTLYELFLYVFYNKSFKSNLQQLSLKI